MQNDFKAPALARGAYNFYFLFNFKNNKSGIAQCSAFCSQLSVASHPAWQFLSFALQKYLLLAPEHRAGSAICPHPFGLTECHPGAQSFLFNEKLIGCLWVLFKILPCLRRVHMNVGEREIHLQRSSPDLLCALLQTAGISHHPTQMGLGD